MRRQRSVDIRATPRAYEHGIARPEREHRVARVALDGHDPPLTRELFAGQERLSQRDAAIPNPAVHSDPSRCPGMVVGPARRGDHPRTIPRRPLGLTRTEPHHRGREDRNEGERCEHIQHGSHCRRGDAREPLRSRCVCETGRVDAGFVVASNATVNVLGGALVILGVVLLAVTVSFWRAAVEDPEVLAPLEVMADRRFARADESKRLALLNQVRPEGAEPVVHLAAPPVLTREPDSEPERPFRDPFPHDDDAVDVRERTGEPVPTIIDPLLSQRAAERDLDSDPDTTDTGE